ncbi:O-methyltransferase [Pasteurella testudinis]|uniref:O-methyltransferase n=1 Tax=Pasteurella testudinis TaxID=761 RepID=UPI004058E89B
MSSGGTLPYHLRQNKAIDRILFIDILNKINNYKNISDYEYIGFGGPFLEDFKIIHRELKIKNMISIEEDINVHRRQLFNKPLSCIRFEHKSSADFISSHDFDQKNSALIIWLDYTKPDYGNQLIEIQNLIEKLSPNDIFKITLNAHVSNLGKPSNQEANDDLQEYRLKEFKEKINEAEFLPSNLSPQDMTTKYFPSCILKICENAIKKGCQAHDLNPHIILYCSYKDGQEMVSLTGILLENNSNKLNNFKERSRLPHWKFYAEGKSINNPNYTNEVLHNINLPVLSIKERLLIEENLPECGDPKKIIEKLKFQILSNQTENEQQIQNFLDYYRTFPWFAKISL